MFFFNKISILLHILIYILLQYHINSGVPPPLEYEVWKKWKYMTPEEKLPHLLTSDDYYTYDSEWASLDTDKDGFITYKELAIRLEEFSDKKMIDSFWEEILFYSGDETEKLTKTAYMLARGHYDKYGNYFDASEYDMRENILLEEADFRLTTADETFIPLELDENGNIIDV